MFTLKVDRGGIIVYRHFPTRPEMGEGARRELRGGHTVLAMFLPGERWA